MHSSHMFLRCSLVGLALIFSGSAGAANLSYTLSRDADRCEAWPRDASGHSGEHMTGSAATGDTSTTSDMAQRHARG